MHKILSAIAFVSIIIPWAVAQDNAAQPGNMPDELPFCPPQNCLYYAGDFDSTSKGANGLANANNQIDEAEVWVGVKPTQNATITGATFNEFFTARGVGVNPTPFAVQVGIKEGQRGKTVCATRGNAIERSNGESDFGYTQYSYTIKKLRKACTFNKGTLYFVNLLPTFDDGTTWAFLANVGPKAKNHQGWPNQPNRCFINYPQAKQHYGKCSGEYSIALTGTEN